MHPSSGSRADAVAAPVPHEARAAAHPDRLLEVDALRGLAALAVVAFHYTTRFVELYGQGQHPTLAAPHGHYGVNLFFIISGFVIFMTLDRTRVAMDFVVSRFSRLYPAYWVAVALTFAITTAFGLPGKEVGFWHAVANLTMVHSLFQVPHVDGVYWTLEVELLFYAGMLCLFASGHLHRVDVPLALLILLRLTWHVAATFNVELSWTLSRLLILKQIPWFALGIFVFQLSSGKDRALASRLRLTAVLALSCLWIVEGWQTALLALALSALVYAAAAGRMTGLRHPVLVFFGAISYTLYLLHENIGWVVQRAVQAAGLSFDTSIGIAFATSVGLATALTFLVERPAMRWIRQRYRSRMARARR